MLRKATKRDVDLAMKQLRGMYRIGEEARKQKGPREETYGRSLATKLAEKHSMAASDVFAARQFAERYTEKDVEELIAMCQSAGFPLGKTHIAKLITARNRRERKRLQRKCIQEGWTAKTLQANLKGKYGKRSPGGAKFRPPKSVEDAKGKIADLCRKLLDFHEAMKSADPDSDEDCGLTELPEGVRKQLRRTMTQVEKLVATCDCDE
jgi:hypothetical protein